MKVRELIEKLKEFDTELPVAVADWTEEYNKPSEWEAEVVNLCDGKYLSRDRHAVATGAVVVIGASRSNP